MFAMSDAFHEAFATQYREPIHVKVEVRTADDIFLYTLYSDDGQVLNLDIEETIGNSDILPLGLAVSAKATLLVNGFAIEEIKAWHNLRPYVSIGDLNEWCPLGRFYVDIDEVSAVDSDGSAELVCYDAIAYSETVPYDSKLIFPQTIEAIFNEALELCGLTAKYAPGFSSKVIEEEPLDMNCRQIFEAIAGLEGKNIRMSRDGQVELMFFTSVPVQITAPKVLSGSKLNSAENVDVSRIHVVAGNTEYWLTNSAEVDGAIFDISADGSEVQAKLYEIESGGYGVEIFGTGETRSCFSELPPWEEVLNELGGELKEVRVTDGVTSIGEAMFMGSPVQEVYLASSVKTIGEFAFMDTYSLKTFVADGIDTIESMAFSGSHIVEIKLPETVRIMRDAVFYNCPYLGKRGAFHIPAGVATIGSTSSVGGEGFFQGCSGLKEVVFDGQSSANLSINKRFLLESTVQKVTMPGQKSDYTNYPFGANSGTKFTFTGVSYDEYSS